MRLRSRSGGGDGAGCSKCRAQIRGGDDVFLQEHRRRCPREKGWRQIALRSGACLTKTRLQGGSWPEDWRRAARVFQSPLFSLSRVDHAGKRQGGERNSLRHPRLYPEVTLLLCVFFLGFFPIRYRVCVALPFVAVHRRHSRRTRLLLRPPGCSNDVRDQATLPVSSPFQAVAPLAAGLRQAGARFASAPPAFSRGHRHRCS